MEKMLKISLSQNPFSGSVQINFENKASNLLKSFIVGHCNRFIGEKLGRHTIEQMAQSCNIILYDLIRCGCVRAGFDGEWGFVKFVKGIAVRDYYLHFAKLTGE